MRTTAARLLEGYCRERTKSVNSSGTTTTDAPDAAKAHRLLHVEDSAFQMRRNMCRTAVRIDRKHMDSASSTGNTTPPGVVTPAHSSLANACVGESSRQLVDVFYALVTYSSLTLTN